jgi:AraC family transcriptional regulator
LVVHPQYHFHANHFGPDGTFLLNLPLENSESDLAGYRAGPVANPTELADFALRDPTGAVSACLEEAKLLKPLSPPPWLEHFIGALLATDCPVAELARSNRVSHAHATRMCHRWYAMNPIDLRREFRVRRAMRLLSEGATPADVAAETGFSDQPHLTRVMKSRIGLTPGQYRQASLGCPLGGAC